MQNIDQKDTIYKLEPTIYLLLCLLISLLLFRLFTIYISKTDLFFDEAQYWAWSQNLDFGYFSKPPFLAWSIRFSTELCGLEEFCIRAPSPIFHYLTALFIFMAGRTLYNSKIGFWSSLAFATIPGISFSSSLISTDVPLLTFWALALWAFVELQKNNRWHWSILLGIAMGLGLLSKYAMLFFLLGMSVYLIAVPEARRLIGNIKFWTAIAIAAIIISPNILWNLENGLVTFSHTADNANWKGFVIHPHKALEFFAAQFGVFGPILFSVLLLTLWRLVKYKNDKKSQYHLTNNDKMLLSFSVTIIAAITIQALLSRAHANWAATAYPAATILVIALMIRYQAWKILTTSFLLHIILIIIMTLGNATAGQYSLTKKIDPYHRVLGWEEISKKVQGKFNSGEFKAILTNTRDISAELVYYLHDKPITVYAWKQGTVPRDYYQMTRPFPKENNIEPVLLVTKHQSPQNVLKHFNVVKELGSEETRAGPNKKRKLYFYSLSGFKKTQSNDG